MIVKIKITNGGNSHIKFQYEPLISTSIISVIMDIMDQENFDTIVSLVMSNPKYIKIT